ncbi:Utp14-domain-containing protein [Peniophora sp. CONT]|nr:Utp14-domain-containing protein [Peniophora sp. CONT]
MARTTNGRPVKSYPSARKANAAGYAKRQERKVKTGALSDVYEHQQQRVRRDKVKLDFDREEEADRGGAGSDDDGFDRDALRARLIGENVDDEMIDSEDDEELDSDAAFESGDEDQYAGFSFGQKKSQVGRAAHGKAKARLPDVNLDEDEDSELGGSDGVRDVDGEEEEEEEEGEFFDVLDMLEGRGDEALEEAEKAEQRKERSRRNEDAEEGSDEDEEEDGQEEDVIMSADEGSVDENAVDGLARFVTSLDAGKKRKADDAGEDASRRKRRILAERTQAGPENEFATRAGSSKLQLDDLLAPLTSASDSVLALKKSAKTLTSARTGKKLSAPLPTRAQERLDREAAYEQTKAEVDKWNDTMKQIREAEHLAFPLQAKPKENTSNLALASKFQPTTEMETSVDKLLKKAQMREEDLAHTEELKMNHLSVEEVAARRAEVRKMRELTFRAEVKAKRMAKIKSKTFRRIKKKERERLAAQGGDGVDSDDEDAMLKHEAARAKERATLRHKNTGKWAKAMHGRGELDADQRQDIHDMLDRGEKLRRRIEGRKDSDASEEESSDDEADPDALRSRAFDELEALKGDAETDDLGGGTKGKSVFNMKFMRDAAAREQREVDRQADDFAREIGAVEGGSDEEDGEGAHAEPSSNTFERVGGRMSFRPGPQAAGEVSGVFVPAPSDTSSTTLKTAELPTLSPPTSLAALDSGFSTTANPWLVASGRGSGPKRAEVAVGKNSNSADKFKDKLSKQQLRREDEREAAAEDAELELEPDQALVLSTTKPASPATATSKTSKTKQSKGKRTAPAAANAADANDDDDSSSDSEVELQERQLERKGGKQGAMAFKQRDLVAMAFAGDNVVEEFEEAKRREIEADAPKEIDTTLPGWGNWGGSGTRKAAPKPHLIKKVAGVDPKSRADYGKKHVVISEKRDKKAAKYLVKDLPYPYTSQAQYERSLATPVGAEWNTRVAFQRATLPKITKKMGVVINPLQKKV